MPDITVVIPVAPYHIDLLPRALGSVRAQTTPCAVIPVYDEDGKGAGWARNHGMEQVTTPLVVFLDADDELLPTFAARTLAVYQQTGRYVYTDFRDTDGKRYHTSDCPWMEKRWHAVTTLMPMAWMREIGGFDEDMDYAEDTELYAHLTRTGHCGIRLPEILFIYHKGGLRSKQGEAAEVRERIMREINQRYQEKIMGCCGTPPKPSAALSAAYGTVKASPAWGMGKRQVIGSRSGKNYGRIDSGYVIDVDVRDAEARPDLWNVLEAPKSTNGKAEAVEEPPGLVTPFHVMARKLWRGFGMQTPQSTAPSKPLPTAEPVPVKPDVERMIEYARKMYPREQVGAPITLPAVHIQRDPVFVFPDKEYASYTDVRRLVELSGFEAVKITDPAKIDDGTALIYLSPEQPYSFTWHPSRSIWWSLEYGGEYEPDLTNWRGEVWASDPAWAVAHDAKMVVMGSHPRLADAIRELVINDRKYDAIMLAYMTGRRIELQQKMPDIHFPREPYPGYGISRDEQLVNTRLMLHAHQDDARRAIAPQRFALCAAYHLPLIYESVPDAGAYADYAIFADYADLPMVTRNYLSGNYDDPTMTPIGERLHTWLCVENTFRKSVMEALK